jgi:sulfatase maturation enzyme AslB (radical SAM superfamily)
MRGFQPTWVTLLKVAAWPNCSTPSDTPRWCVLVSPRGGILLRVMCKVRVSEAGVHLFDRVSGLNILVDEVNVPEGQASRAPRYLSVALTNACELRCAYCYAPKHSAMLGMDRVAAWAAELDGAGCLGVGFGGGEPTSHPQFAQLCAQVAESTSMAVTFTTHGHRLTPGLADALRGSVHFARLSVDGVGATYERLRHRPFATVIAAADLLRTVAPIGINVVVNADTIGELDDLAEFAVDVGASELLLLPEQPTAATPGISDADAERLIRWIRTTRTRVRLAISRSGLEASVPTVEAIPGERPLDAHMHVDAGGVLRPHAYASAGTPIEGSILDAVQTLRKAA